MEKEWKKLETIPAWQQERVNSKKEVILEAQRDKKKVHFATLMVICHLKNAELETQLQKYKGRVVLRGDFEKDDSGAFADFTVQRSSASQMTAAKVVDVIARLPDCDGQAVDAVFRVHSSQSGRRTIVIQKKNRSQNVQIFGYVFHETNGQNHGITLKILLNEICSVTHSQAFREKDTSKKFSNWECLFVHRKPRIILIGTRG